MLTSCQKRPARCTWRAAICNTPHCFFNAITRALFVQYPIAGPRQLPGDAAQLPQAHVEVAVAIMHEVDRVDQTEGSLEQIDLVPVGELVPASDAIAKGKLAGGECVTSPNASSRRRWHLLVGSDWATSPNARDCPLLP